MATVSVPFIIILSKDLKVATKHNTNGDILATIVWYIEAQTNMAALRKRHFSMGFDLNYRDLYLYLHSNFTMLFYDNFFFKLYVSRCYVT